MSSERRLVPESYNFPAMAECGGTLTYRYDQQNGMEGMLFMLSAAASDADILAGIGSCYNAVGMSAEMMIVQLFDLYGDGRIHLAAVVRDLQDKSKYGHIFGPYYDNHILIFENRQSKGGPPQFKGFILKQKCRLFRYFEDIGKKPGVPVLRDRGLLRQRNGRVSVGEYSWPWICDWDGRGVWDIVIGTREMLLLFRNSGTMRNPLYTPGERMKLWGEPIKHSVHSLRPFPVDWDGTGRMDLIVGSESGWFHLFRRPALKGTCPKAELSKIQERK